MHRSQKITFGEMRESGVRGVLIYCRDHHCSHAVAMSADQIIFAYPISKRDSRRACGKRGADVRPNFNRTQKPVLAMGQ